MVTHPRNIPHAWGNRSSSRLRIAGDCVPRTVLRKILRIMAGRGAVIEFPRWPRGSVLSPVGPTPF